MITDIIVNAMDEAECGTRKDYVTGDFGDLAGAVFAKFGGLSCTRLRFYIRSWPCLHLTRPTNTTNLTVVIA